MENGKWKVENGKLKMESGKWKVENGKWKMESGKWKGLVAAGFKSVAHIVLYRKI